MELLIISTYPKMSVMQIIVTRIENKADHSQPWVMWENVVRTKAILLIPTPSPIMETLLSDTASMTPEKGPLLSGSEMLSSMRLLSATP